MARFGIDEFQFEQAKQWVGSSGIRWGVDSSTATEFDPTCNRAKYLAIWYSAHALRLCDVGFCRFV
ncbi:exodeoxyribonuclease V subunit gamma [Vibrio chagasii]|nr:exodeoxyribonuclease V subunit gamma [Vibrio chagasii]